MIFSITPFKNAGVIKFGMHIDQVRATLGLAFESFKRTSTAALPCDYFSGIGVFVYYKPPGIVEAIEFSIPADLELNGINLLKLSYVDLKNLLKLEDENLDVEYDSLTSHKLGIGAYAPNAADDPYLPVESVIIFENGYYD